MRHGMPYEASHAALDRRRIAPIGDRGLIVSVVSWVLLVAMVFVLLGRFVVKGVVCRNLKRWVSWDDGFIFLAAIFSIGQTAACSIESVNVLGQHVQDVEVGQMVIFMKAEYASCMLYIANLGCARVSVCLLISQILPGKPQQYTALAFAFFSVLWTFSGILVTAFPCHLPQPWNFFTEKCIDVHKFVNYVAVSNIVVEVLLVCLPLGVWNLRLKSTGRGLSVGLVFVARLTIVVCVITQLIYFNRYVYSPDFTYDYWRTTLCIQIAQNMSVISACVPYFHPFILSILSGATKKEDLAVYHQCKACEKISHYFREKDGNLEDAKSGSEDDEAMISGLNYVAPLATYGLDEGSTGGRVGAGRSNGRGCGRHSGAARASTGAVREGVHGRGGSIRFSDSSITVTPGSTTAATSPALSATTSRPHIQLPPPSHTNTEMVFNRVVPIPSSTSSSRSPNPLPSISNSTGPAQPPPPKSLSQVGVLPVVDWDTDSERNSEGSPTSTHNRPRDRDSEYVFRREQVVSIPEEDGRWERGSMAAFRPPERPQDGER